MPELRLSLSPTNIPAGEKVRLSLNAQHHLRGTLHNLCINLTGGSGVVVFGNNRLHFNPIAPEIVATQDVYVQVNKEGKATLRLHTINGKILGHIERFSDTSFDLNVFRAGISEKDISLIYKAKVLSQNKWGQIDLHVQNLSTIPLDSVTLTLAFDQPSVELAKQPGPSKLLQPGESTSFGFPVLPRESGAVSWRVEITVQAAGQSVRKQLKFNSSVAPDNRPQTTNIHQETNIHGDVVQTGRGNVIGGSTTPISPVGQVSQKTEIKGDFVQTGKGNVIGNVINQDRGSHTEQTASFQGDQVQAGQGNLIGNVNTNPPETGSAHEPSYNSDPKSSELPIGDLSMRSTCPYCHHQIPEGRICDKCGKVLPE